MELEKVYKKVLFKADFTVFGAQKEVVEATSRVQNPLDNDKTRLFIIPVGSSASPFSSKALKCGAGGGGGLLVRKPGKKVSKMGFPMTPNHLGCSNG